VLISLKNVLCCSLSRMYCVALSQGCIELLSLKNARQEYTAKAREFEQRKLLETLSPKP